MGHRDNDYLLDIDGMSPDDNVEDINVSSAFKGRPWLMVYWECCHTYSRVYRNQEGTMYIGHCPKCLKRVRAKVGPDGTSKRLFRAK